MTGSSQRPLASSIDSVSIGGSLPAYASTPTFNVGTIPTVNVAPQARSASGNITAINADIALAVQGLGGVAIDLRGTFVATVTFQGTVDGTNWFALQATPVGSAGNVAPVTTATAAGSWFINCAGLAQVRARATAFTSGTITATLNAMTAAPWVYVAPVGATWAVSGSLTTVSTVTTVSSVTSSQTAIPGIITDVASAALTTTTTTGTLTPTFGSTYVVSIPVTVVSGTNPTLDVVVQESDNSGTGWYDVFHFPRITATGIYRSPKLPLNGNRIRYVQTVAGTTPSFTRSIVRLQASDSVATYRQLFNRTIDTTTLNATTPVLNVAGCRNVQLVINLGAATTPPTIQLEGSDDNANWYALGTALAGVASSTVQVTVPASSSAFIRGRVSSAGSTVTLGYVMLKGF